jgi:hypothetical protein
LPRKARKNMEFSRVLEKGRPQQISGRVGEGGGAAAMTITTAPTTRNFRKFSHRAKINQIYFISSPSFWKDSSYRITIGLLSNQLHGGEYVLRN